MSVMHVHKTFKFNQLNVFVSKLVRNMINRLVNVVKDFTKIRIKIVKLVMKHAQLAQVK